MIEEAVEDEEATGRLAGILQQVARNNGTRPSSLEIQAAVGFVRQYVEHVPYYLDSVRSAAAGAGIGEQMDQMLTELEAYWFEPNDVIPDHLGLAGVTDDAYASMVLLQTISDHCMATNGRPLLELNFAMANQAIHAIIGEPHASVLDQQVGVTIGNAMMQQALGQLGQFIGSGAFPVVGSVPDPIC